MFDCKVSDHVSDAGAQSEDEPHVAYGPREKFPSTKGNGMPTEKVKPSRVLASRTNSAPPKDAGTKRTRKAVWSPADIKSYGVKPCGEVPDKRESQFTCDLPEKSPISMGAGMPTGNVKPSKVMASRTNSVPSSDGGDAQSMRETQCSGGVVKTFPSTKGNGRPGEKVKPIADMASRTNSVPSSGGGDAQSTCETHFSGGVVKKSGRKASSEKVHCANETQMATDLSEIIGVIRDLNTQLNFALDTRNRQDLATRAIVGRFCGYSNVAPKKERDAANARTAHILKVLLKGEPAAPEDEHILKNTRQLVTAAASMREPWELIKKELEVRMRKLAQMLPVYPWAKDIKGFGDLSLARLIGEAGDISRYKNPQCLWKRMGLAVIDGNRQGNPGGTHYDAEGKIIKRKVSAEDWIEQKYSPRRRSVAWNIADPIVKWGVQVPKDAETGERAGPTVAVTEYGRIYLNRKEYELATRHGLSEKTPQGHAEARARRYMTKRLLRELWCAWRRAAGTYVAEDTSWRTENLLAAE